MADGPLKHDAAFQQEYSKALNALQHDTKFAKSLENRKTILGFVLDTNTHKGVLTAPAAILDSTFTDRIPFIKAEGHTANLDMLQTNAFSGGFFDNPLVDYDGVYRRVPLLQEYEGMLQESLALALTRAAPGSPGLELIVESMHEHENELFLEWIKIGDVVIPVDERAAILIPYLGPQKSFSYISAIEILNKSPPIEDLNGKIALIGASAPGLLDLRTTPLDAAFPGVEIHANIIRGILDQTVMHQPAYTTGFEFLLL
jgi:adenylate cyclase